MLKYTNERPKYLNIIICILSILFYFLLPGLFLSVIQKIIHNESVSTIIALLLYLMILYLVYFKDLNLEFKTFIKDFKNNFKKGFKYYLVGIFAMIFFNLTIAIFIKNISANETAVREMLFASPVMSLIQISLLAPITEEIMFRKSVMSCCKNKWVFAFITAILFGGAHLVAGDLSLINLVYILPYGSLGFVFALMDSETNTTFTSVFMHMIHNTFTALLLLSFSFLGLL